MYIFGASYFETSILKNAFQVVFLFFIASEVLIWTFTSWHSRKSTGKKEKGDKGSFLFLMTGFLVTIFLNMICRKSFSFRMPMFLFWIGAILIVLGVLLRCYSVWTLRNFFTLSVQVNSEQKIIQSGPYKYIRHPAYSGSIITLLGIALSFRSPIGLLGTLLITGCIYSYRINVEEKILERSFGAIYKTYEEKTCRVIPFIW